jgi:hypothetical protein
MSRDVKHSPGPWRVSDKFNVWGRGTVSNWAGLTKSVLVANSCVGGLAPDRPTKHECEANARLIAAAPELLEACQFALDLSLGNIKGDRYDLQNRMQEVIRKATTNNQAKG